MCESRREVIEKSPLIQKAIKELDRLSAKEGNGHVRSEILGYEIGIETYLRGEQTHQDIILVAESVEKLVERERERGKFPSVLYQLLKMPVMGWPLAGAALLIIWLIGQIGHGVLISILKAVGFDAAPSDVQVVVAVVAVGLILTAVRKYISYVDKCEKKSTEKDE